MRLDWLIGEAGPRDDERRGWVEDGAAVLLAAIALLLIVAAWGCAPVPVTSPTTAAAPDPGPLPTWYLNGSADGSTYSLYRADGTPLPCPARYCAWPSAVEVAGVDYVAGSVWSDAGKADARVGLWVGGAYVGALDGVGALQTHPELRRLADGTWVLATADWTRLGSVGPTSARLWRAAEPAGPWSDAGEVYRSSSDADAAGFSVDYLCETGGAWALYLSGYPAPGVGSSALVVTALDVAGPYGDPRVLLAPGALTLIGGLPLLAANVSPSAVLAGRAVGTGYGVAPDGTWYERTFWISGPALGPWAVTGEAAHVAPAGLASWENAEPALRGTACEEV